MFHKVRTNSFSVDTIFGKDRGTYSQNKMTELVQCLLTDYHNGSQG